MTGVQLRAMGTTADFAPRIKRAAHRLSTGQSLIVIPDTNRSDANGANVTGTARFVVYMSSDSARTAYSAAINYQPATALSSSTREAVCSSAVAENNNLYIVYQGTDNSLRIITFVYSAGTYGAGSEQTIVAGGAVTRRFRAVDIDICPTNANPAVAAYEANAATGQGAYARVYVRLNDGTTWIKAWEDNFHPTEFIRTYSEDVSIAWNKAGLSSNVGQIGVYYTKTHTTADKGDRAVEIQFNTSTGTTNSATLVGSWFTDLYINTASGSRRGYLFSEASGVWMFGTAVGSSAPFFMACRLRHNVFTGIIRNRTSNSLMSYRDHFMVIHKDNNPFTAVSAEYCDGNLVFGFSGIGQIVNFLARSVVIRFPTDTLLNDAVTIDTAARVLDNGYNLADGVIVIAGGGNKYNNTGQYAYNFFIMHGTKGNTVDGNELADPLVLPRYGRGISEDSIAPPQILTPSAGSTQTVNRATVRVSIQNTQPYSSVFGKLEFQVASDSGFTTNLQTIAQADAEFFSYSATTSQTPPTRVIIHVLTQSQALDTGTWYIRARVKDDLGGSSAWSSTSSFQILHPPVATPVAPGNGTNHIYGTGDRTFSWTFGDTEPTDSQSAYRLLIVRNDTGATVLDTGKVVSTASSVTANLASGLKDIPLQWSVSLWDSDDTLGPLSNPCTFTVLDPPAVTITTPTPGSVVMNANGTFEVDAANWTGANGSFVRSTAQFHSGVASGLFTPNGSSLTGTVTSDFITVTANHMYRLSSWLRTPTTWAGGVGVTIDWYTSADALISSSTEPLASLTGATWTQLVAHGVAPANAAKAKVVLYITGTPAAGNTLFLDDVEFGRGLSTTALPTIQWSFIVGGTRTQRAFRVRVWDVAQTPDVEVGDSGWVFSAATSYTFGSQILEQFGSYRADVFVQDSLTLQDSDYVTFTTDWTEPVDGDTAVVSDNFKNTISWTDANLDTDWVAWRVYRRYMKTASADLDVLSTATTWELIYETDEALTSYSYRDYTAPLNKPIDYVVVQLVDRFGSLLESNITAYETITQTGDRYFFVPAVPVGTIASFEASSVSSDSFSKEVEQNTVHVIGRGRQVQIGDDLGYIGTLTIKLRNPATARIEREFFEYLASDDAGKVYIKSPFGDVLYVSLGNPSTNRIPGMGTADLVDMTLPYVQVFDDAPILRAG